ncbi:MAG: DUF4129 domain-containing protein [Pseudomonadota bacterium]
MLRAAPIAGCLFLCATLSASAQLAEPTPLRVEPSDTGREYLAQTRWNNIKSDVTYFDPTGPAPEISTNADVPPEQQDRDPINVTPGEIRIGGVLIALAVIIGIVILISVFGNFSVTSLKKEDDGSSGKTRTRKTTNLDGDEEIPALAHIRAMTDKVAALNLLLAGALSIAAQQQGMRLHPSWTVRDTLRRIPKSWPFRPALADLAGEAEKAHFGGRPVTDEALEHHLQAMTPVYSGAAA